MKKNPNQNKNTPQSAASFAPTLFAEMRTASTIAIHAQLWQIFSNGTHSPPRGERLKEILFTG